MRQFAVIILFSVCSCAMSTSVWRSYADYLHRENLTALRIDSIGTVFVRSSHDILQFSNDERNTYINPVEKCLSICTESPQENDYTNIPVFMFQCLNNTIYLMTCCSYGPCFFHDISNISNFRMANTPPDQTVPLISSKGSALAVSGPCDNVLGKIISAVSPRNDEITMTFSVLNFYVEKGDFYLKYLEHGRQFYITSNENTYFEFIYGFHDALNSDYFAYFLRNIRTTDGARVAYISQICVDDLYFRSYVESKIECDGYATLEAATVLHLTPERSLLIGAFTGHKKYVETKVCTYDVSRGIFLHFQMVQQHCFYNVTGSAPSWIKMNKNDSEATCKWPINKKIIYCGYTGKNQRIQGNATLDSKDVLWTVNETITSVVLDLFRDIVVGYFGSKNGIIRKVIFDNLNLTKNMELFMWTNGHQERIVQMSLDNARNRLYFIQGSTVGLIRIDNCTNHKDCHGCLEDIITCVWITDVSEQQGSCVNNGSKQTKFDSFCPPIVASIVSIGGPTSEDIRLTVKGTFVLSPTTVNGFEKYGNDNSSLQITIGGTQCKITSVTALPNSIVCVTPSNALKTGENYILNISVTGDKTTGIIPFLKVHTFGWKQFNFSCKIEKIVKVTSPVKLSGGIQILLHGENLGIRSPLNVFIGGVPCPVTDYDRAAADMITCKAPAMQSEGTYNTSVHLGDKILVGPNVTYLPEPYITNSSINKTIHSGGVSVVFQGEHLAGLGETVNIVVKSKLNNETLTQSSSCVVLAELRCTYGNSLNTDTEPVNGTVQFYNMYGNLLLKPRNSELFVTIMDDPNFFNFSKDEEHHISQNGITIPFLFKGRNLLNCDKIEIKLTIGPHICIITMVTELDLSCTVLDNIDHIKVGVRHEVNVSIGTNIPNSLGFIIFRNKETTHLVDLIVGVVLAGIGVISVLLVCRKIWHKFGNKTNNNQYNILFRQNSSPLILDYLTDNLNSEIGHNRSNDYHDRARCQPSTEKDTDSYIPLLDDDICAILKEKELLIDRECLILGEVIGQGHFSCVYKGYLRLPNEKEELIVAAKTLHRNNPRDFNVEMFLKEALIMKDFCHKNVMTLSGICFGIEKLPFVMLPFMKHGDLLSYIRDVNNVPTVKDLVVFSVDIANGMHYLSELKFVHRDLAARNCMIGDDMLVKVADFGLSRDVYEKEYYSSRDAKTKLPVKWMSPESLEFGMFSTKSDIWSFGVVIWELLTRGMNPYPTVDNWDMLLYLQSGRRCCKPDYCPEEMFRIMQQCWEWDPDKRPTFEELTVKIPELLKRLERASERRRDNNSMTEEISNDL